MKYFSAASGRATRHIYCQVKPPDETNIPLFPGRTYALKLIDLPGYTFAESVEDSANTAHQTKYSPEKGSAENMSHPRFGVGQKQYPPCDKVGADSDTGMAEYKRGYSSPPEGQVYQGATYQKRDQSRDGVGFDETVNTERDQQNTKYGIDTAGFHLRILSG